MTSLWFFCLLTTKLITSLLRMALWMCCGTAKQILGSLHLLIWCLVVGTIGILLLVSSPVPNPSRETVLQTAKTYWQGVASSHVSRDVFYNLTVIHTFLGENELANDAHISQEWVDPNTATYKN